MEPASETPQAPPRAALIVTVDGPGGAGKSTVSRRLARRLGVPYLNSGYIYRAVTVLVLEREVDFDDAVAVQRIVEGMDLRFREDSDSTRVFLGERDITSRLKDPDVTPQIYRIANHAPYRTLLVDLQRRCVAPEGLVAEGRDMGTVIFPEAAFKFYLDASPEIRARRQLRDLEAAGHRRSFEDVLREVLERDRHDRDRKDAPLRVAPGAEVILTDDLGISEVVDRMLAKVRSRQPGATLAAAPRGGTNA